MYIGLPNLGLNGVGGGLKPGLNLDFISTETPDSRLTFSGGAGGTRFNSAGTLVSASAPRYDYNPSTLAPLGMLSERQRTNSVRNSSATGGTAGVIGSGGVSATGWFTSTALTGLTMAVAFGSENGIPYQEFSISGTPSGAGAVTLGYVGNTATAAATGQFWVTALFARLSSGSLTGVTSAIIVTSERDAGGTFLTSGNNAVALPTNAALNTQRVNGQRTLNQATTAFVASNYMLNLSGVAVNFAIRIGAPQMELVPDVNSAASTPILTTTVVVTRTEDIVSMTSTNFSSWYNQVNGTFVTKFDSFAPTATGFVRVFEVDDGTGANVLGILANNGAGTYFANSTVASVGQASLFTSAVTANVARKEAFAYAAANFGLSDNGGVTATALAGTIPTVNSLYIGNQVGGNAALNGHIQYLKYYPTRLPDATLPTL